MSRRALILLVSLVSILAVISVYFGFYGKDDKRVNTKTEAATSSKTLTSNAEWTAGTNTNTTISADPGSSVTMNDKTSGAQLDTTGMTTTSANPVDGDINTYYGAAFGDSLLWEIDFGQSYYLTEIISRKPIAYIGAVGGIQLSINGVDWSSYAQDYWDADETHQPINASARYAKFYSTAPTPPEGWRVYEVEFYQGASATHISSATQLDGGTHFKDWTTFVPDDDIPANTSVNYRFRTSDDHATWGSYTASTASAGSIDIATLLGAGDAAKRYLQVETTLANTDGASTPTLNAYTANYNYSALDHLTVLPANASVQVNGTQSLTASAIDDYGDPILDATFTWSTTCGTVDAAGTTVTFTAPAAVPGGNTCTVTASSTVDGVTKTLDAVMTVTATPPDPPTCSDGIQNGTETGVDCGGSCPACTADPTCSDGIQNGSETGVDTGGSCGSTCPAGGESACQQQAQDAESACFTNPPVGKTQQECVSEARCAGQACIVGCGGSGADMAVGTKVLVPNGGETYQLTRTMTVNWVYGNGNVDPNTPGAFPDLSKGEKTSFQNVPIGVVLSTDGGATYNKMLEMIYPAYLGNLTSGNVYSDWIAGQYGGYKPYTSYHAYNANSAIKNGYYSYSFYIPNAVSLISNTAKIKLVPVVFGCGGIIKPDESDYNFRIVAGPTTPPPALICPGPNCPCIGPDCSCTTDTCICTGPDCLCSNPDICQTCIGDSCTPCTGNECKPCVGDDCGPKACVGDACIPCTGIFCHIFPPETAGPICIGSFCVQTPHGWPINPFLLIPLLAALVLTLANPQNLSLISNAASRMSGLFAKGKDKKHSPGVVYDGATGLPLAGVIIMLFRARDKKLIHTVKSDKNGKFALETPPGEEYYVEIDKIGYDLVKNQGLQSAELAYDQNYFAKNIFRPAETEKLFNKALPLEANSEALAETKKFKSLESISKILRILNLPIILFGFAISGIAYSKSHTIINLIILCLYGVLITYYLVKYLVLSGRGFGKVYDINNGQGIELATINLISESDGKLKATSVSDAKGRFLVALPKGFYKILISKPGYSTHIHHSVRIKSSLTPARVIIGMDEVRVANKPSVKPVLASQPTTSRREIVDSADIIEKYNQKRSKFGTADISNVGIHHLINQKPRLTSPAESQDQLRVPTDNELPKPEKPNWQIPGSHTPL
ncbi:MAG: carboxypeptidase regulatory-like domain-containing protein [Candidatus Berkelbacteria bacterium]